MHTATSASAPSQSQSVLPGTFVKPGVGTTICAAMLPLPHSVAQPVDVNLAPAPMVKAVTATADEARTFAEGDPFYQKGLRSFEVHEWVFMEGSMTVTLNFAENTISVTTHHALIPIDRKKAVNCFQRRISCKASALSASAISAWRSASI